MLRLVCTYRYILNLSVASAQTRPPSRNKLFSTKAVTISYCTLSENGDMLLHKVAPIIVAVPAGTGNANKSYKDDEKTYHVVFTFASHLLPLYIAASKSLSYAKSNK